MTKKLFYIYGHYFWNDTMQRDTKILDVFPRNTGIVQIEKKTKIFRNRKAKIKTRIDQATNIFLKK